MATPAAQITRPSFLLDLNLSGRVFYFTTSPTKIELTVDGAIRVYNTGLNSLSVTIQAGSPLSGVGISVKPAAIPWGQLVAQGVRLQLGRGVLRRHYEGQTLDEATILLRGQVKEPTYGAKEDPLQFSLRREFIRQGQIPTPDMKANSTTWPLAVESAEGVDYPIVFGRPGFFPNEEGALGFSIGTVPAFINVVPSTGVIPDYRALVAGHPVAATQVILVDQSAHKSRALPIIEMVDGSGRVVSAVSFGGQVGTRKEMTLPLIADKYATAWFEGGGVPTRDDATVAMRGLGDILQYLIEEWTTIPLDVGRNQANISQLNAFKLDFAITKGTNVWGFIQSRILSLFPVEWIEGLEGGYFRMNRLVDTTVVDSTYSIDATPLTGNVNRRSGIVYVGEISNKITLEYAVSGAQNRFRKRLTIDADAIADQPEVIPSAYAKHSQSLLRDDDQTPPDDGVRPITIKTSLVSDPATAELILRHKIVELSIKRRAVSVDSDHWLDRFDPSGVLRFTSSDCHITDELVLLRAKTLSDTDVGLDLLFVDDPFLTRRETS